MGGPGSGRKKEQGSKDARKYGNPGNKLPRGLYKWSVSTRKPSQKSKTRTISFGGHTVTISYTKSGKVHI